MIPYTHSNSSNALTVVQSEEEKIQALIQGNSFARIYFLVSDFTVPPIEKKSIKNSNDLIKIYNAFVCIYYQIKSHYIFSVYKIHL